MISKRDLEKAISNLKETSTDKTPKKDKLIQELKSFKGLKKIQLEKKEKSFETKEIEIFKSHTKNVKTKVDYKLIPEINKRILEDDEYKEFLKSVKKFQFKTKTPLSLKREEPSFLKCIKKRNYKLNPVYVYGFYVVK